MLRQQSFDIEFPVDFFENVSYSESLSQGIIFEDAQMLLLRCNLIFLENSFVASFCGACALEHRLKRLSELDNP